STLPSLAAAPSHPSLSRPSHTIYRPLYYLTPCPTHLFIGRFVLIFFEGLCELVLGCSGISRASCGRPSQDIGLGDADLCAHLGHTGCYVLLSTPSTSHHVSSSRMLGVGFN